jgi:hypothetical protein
LPAVDDNFSQDVHRDTVPVSVTSPPPEPEEEGGAEPSDENEEEGKI